MTVDVAVVGGGLVGLTTALLVGREGASRVAVLEAGRVGGGTTGGTTGKVTSQHGLLYARLVERHGEDRARMYAAANQAGVAQVAALAEEYRVDCDLTRAPSFAYTHDAGRRRTLAEEVEAATRLGLPATLTDTAELPFDVEAAVRFDDQLHVHAGRYVAGLATAVADAGGAVFEHTRVTDLGEDDDGVRVTTAAGTVRARHVVVATLLPIGTTGGYFARTRPVRSYGLAVRLRGPAPRSMAISVDTPTRSTRPWRGPGPNGLVVVGNGHETGAEDDTEAMYDDLERWTRATFEVEAVDYRWSAQDYSTPDLVPYVGRSSAHERVLVATGFNKWGLSNGTAAATILADLLAGRDNPWHAVFDAGRIGDAAAVVQLVKDNATVGKDFVGGHVGRIVARHAHDLAPGHGGKLVVGGTTVGGYRDHDGGLHAVSLTCSHLGCALNWNAAESSWDCSCHGSRFDTDGNILTGPAVTPLDRVEVDEPPQ